MNFYVLQKCFAFGYLTEYFVHQGSGFIFESVFV